MPKGRWPRRLRRFDQSLADQPVHALTDTVQIPTEQVSPTQRIVRRVIYAVGALFAAVLIVYLDRHGYRDVESRPNPNHPRSVLACVYYATVSLSPTGYGAITPVTSSARLINVLVITPLRV